jgi:hypothetical protein
MRTRDRKTREQTPVPAPQPASAGPDAENAAERARALLEHGDEIIRRALSSDSRRFLVQNRQQGGQ